MRHRFDTIRLFIMGFTQHLGRTSTGMHKAWESTRAISDSKTLVMPPLAWNSNWNSIADFLSGYADNFTDLRVTAYSWGAGWGFRKLDERLKERQIPIHKAILIDPVWRNPWTPDWLWINPLSMTKIFKVKVSSNVRTVMHFRQSVDYPRSAGRLDIEGKTYVDGPHVIERRHIHMDDDEFVLETVIREMKNVSYEPPDDLFK